MKQSLKIFTLLLLSGNFAYANDNTSADVLLNNVDSTKKEFKVENVQEALNFKVDDLKKIKIDDAYLAMLFTEWKSDDEMSPKMKKWIHGILEHDFKTAMSAIPSEEMGERYQRLKSITELYLFYKLDLAQTFFDSWLNIAKSDSSSSKEFITLDQTVGMTAPAWFADKAITMSDVDRMTIENLDGSKSLFISTAKIWSILRDGKKGLPYLKGLPKGHELILPLANTVVLDLARANNLGDAGYIMKNVVEPEVIATGDPRVLSRYYLLLGRLLYQAKAYDAAEEFYRKIPNSVPEYIEARIEMAWLLLRKNDQEDLRGELASLDQKLFDDHFLPELDLLWAISDLKLCRFPEVKMDFNKFIANNKSWVEKIKKGSQAGVKQPIDTYDYFIELKTKGLGNIENEIKKLETLVKSDSPRWELIKENLKGKKLLADKQLQSEYNRYWKNREIIMANTIRKMRFVKIEMMTRFAIAKKAFEQVRKKQLAMANTSSKNSAKVGIRKSSDELRFPYDGVVWPDELFRLKSDISDYCKK
jgi:tetratricopeptide (TPR) repeat protein